MLKATRVDGVYSADPETNKDAVFMTHYLLMKLFNKT